MTFRPLKYKRYLSEVADEIPKATAFSRKRRQQEHGNHCHYEQRYVAASKYMLVL